MHKTGLFFRTVFFPKFRSIKAVFQSIKSVLKILREPLSVSINQKSWIRFLKIWFWLVQLIFFKTFSNFSFSLRLSKGFSSKFCRFPPIFLQGFPLLRPIRPFYHFFCIYFHVSCINSCIFVGIFGPIQIWGFWRFKPSFLKLIIGFCFDNVINMIHDV